VGLFLFSFRFHFRPDPNDSEEAALAKALTRWIYSICYFHDLEISNLSKDLSDGINLNAFVTGVLNSSLFLGRALCYLVNFYHPTILPLHSIKHTSVRQYVPSQRSHGMKTISENDQSNFVTLRRACRDIGKIPPFLGIYDSVSNFADEKTLILFLTFLFSRIVETSRKINAAFTIQRFVNSHKKTPRKNVNENIFSTVASSPSKSIRNRQSISLNETGLLPRVSFCAKHLSKSVV
jgi:hypothetical protein